MRPVLDNVIVPSGADCFLDGARVTSNVTVGPDADILVELAHIEGSAAIGLDATFESFESENVGNVMCESCFFEDVLSTTRGGNVKIKDERDGSYVQDSSIGGDLSIEESSSGTASFRLEGNTIGGNLTLAKTTGPMSIDGDAIRGNRQLVENVGEVTIANNAVSGNLQLFKTAGPSEVFTSTSRKDLQCGENQPRTAGAGNRAASKQGQCRRL